jgi:TonB family protein
LENGELDSAEKTFLRAVRQQDPPPLFALVGLGKVYLEKENLELAEDFLKRAISQPGVDENSIESILSEVDNFRTATGSKAEILQESIEKPEAQKELSLGKLNRRVKILERTQPEYPKRAVKEGQSGYTILRLFVDERGQLLESECLKGERILCRAAEEAVKKWKFAPKLVNGRPEFDKITVVINFKLEENK